MYKLIAIAFAAVFALSAFADPSTPPANAGINELLDTLHDAGEKLKDFAADVSLTETNGITGESSQNLGHVWYQHLANGDARIRVNFDRKQIGKRIFEQRREYKLEGGNLIDQNFDTKVQVTRQVLKPGQKMNLLKLGEGPFPLPIGQAREDVLKSFDVTRPAAAKEDPANTNHLTLVPKPDTQLARKFNSIDVYVSRQTNFPIRIETVDKDGVTIRTTDLSNLKINAGLKDADFTLPEPGKDWGVRDEAYRQ